MRVVGTVLRRSTCLFLLCAVVGLVPLTGHAALLFDEREWRRLAAADPLEAIEVARLRLDGRVSDAERIRIHVLLGALLGEQLGDLEQGIRHYRAALDVRDSYWEYDEIRYSLALLLISSGDFSEARKHLQQILKNQPEHPQGFSIRATLTDITGKPDRRAPGEKTTPTEPAAVRSADTAASTKAVEGRPSDAKDPPLIRVLLSRANAVTIRSSGPVFLYDGPGEMLSRQREALNCRADGSRVVCGEKTARVIQIIPAKGNYLAVGEDEYRGALVLRVENGRLLTINRLDMESYLYGVLPREVPASWPLDALKAQAVAARTYAFSQLERANDLPYDVESTVMSQVYGGLGAEQASTNEAVDATHGEIMRYGSQVVVAYFHSHSGGFTEDPANVWGASLPYLVSREDPYSQTARNMDWSTKYEWAEFEKPLLDAFPHLGRVRGLRILERTGNRVKRLQVVGSSRSVELSGNRFRILLDPARLKSTAFQVERSGRSLVFEGTGYGHGVGMSQWGAMAMAEEGYDYQRILSFYYSGVTMERIGRL